MIRLIWAGICSTDLEMVKGYYPYTGILGHEFVGKVEESPSDTSWVGARVVGEINIICGDCLYCRNGRTSHCEHRTVLGIKDKAGVFSEYFTLPLKNLHVVPDIVSDEVAVFTEPLAAALEIHQQVHIQPTNKVLIVGAGRLGQLIAQSFATTGCDLTVLIRREKQRHLLDEWGIRCIEQDDIRTGQMDIVIDATGSSEGFDLARSAVRSRGILIVKSTYAGELTVNMSAIVVDEITIVGSRCGPFQPALRYLEKALVNPLPLIDGKFSMADGLEAFKKAAQPGVMKILLSP